MCSTSVFSRPEGLETLGFGFLNPHCTLFIFIKDSATISLHFYVCYTMHYALVPSCLISHNSVSLSAPADSLSIHQCIAYWGYPQWGPRGALKLMAACPIAYSSTVRTRMLSCCRSFLHGKHGQKDARLSPLAAPRCCRAPCIRVPIPT